MNTMNLQQRSLHRRPDPARTGAIGCRELRLTDLALGKAARVVGIDDDQQPEAARRLYDLGFNVGAEVTPLRKSPFGGPRIYRAEDYDIALRPEQARLIRVEEQP